MELELSDDGGAERVVDEELLKYEM